MSEALEQAIERLFNFDITALFPVGIYVVKNTWNEEDGFINEGCEELLERIMDVAEQFIEQGDETGIPQHVLYMCSLAKGCEAERIGDKELAGEYAMRANAYLEEAIDLGLALAYCELGKGMFLGDGIWEQNQEQGLSLLKKAVETPIIPELGVDPEDMEQEIKDVYEACLAQYSEQEQTEESLITSKMVSSGKKPTVFAREEKQFSKGYCIAAIAAFFGYILVSILLRKEYGLQSAYQISADGNFVLGIFAALGLNFAVIPLLLAAYFYQKDNGKHSKVLVCSYFVFLAACFLDGFLPYVKTGALSGENLLYAFVCPLIFLVSHRLLSLLIYAILKGKEGDSDYRIYFGLVLLAPVMFVFLIIAVVFWIFQGVAQDNYNEYQNSDAKRSLDLKEEVRRQLVAGLGIYNVGVYYDNGWKAVDYWDHGCSLTEVVGDDFRNTYLEDPNGKIYILSTNCPDKESVYYFS